MTDDKKKLLEEAFDRMMQVCIYNMDAPLEWIDQYISPTVTGFGTEFDEEIHNIEDCRRLILTAREQSAGLDFKATGSVIHKQVSPDEQEVLFLQQIQVQLMVGGEIMTRALRMSLMVSWENGRWMMTHFHASAPDPGTSIDDTFQVDQWKIRMAELEKMVAEKTADLAQRNKELEIEASLERVRAVAMGMQVPEDMLDMCKVIAEEMRRLSIGGIKLVETIVINESSDFFLDYEYYSDSDYRIVETFRYRENELILQMVDTILHSEDSFYYGGKMERTAKADWFAFMQGSGYYVAPELLAANEVHYHFYSVGQAALGLVTDHALSDDEFQLYKRLRNVFALTYRRYRDIEKAEQQAHEAKIEASLERVRSAANAMKTSDELLQVITIVGQQLENLGLQFDSTNFRTNVGEKDWRLWIYAKWMDQPKQWFIPQIDHPYFSIHEKEGEVVSHVFSREEKDSFEAYLFQLGLIEIPRDPKVAALQKEFMEAAKGFAWSIASIKSVSLNIANSQAKPYTQEENALLLRFTIVFEQAYTRFLDLQKAEAQSREAQIELGLERVRARAMAMQHSEELKELIDTVFTELTRLDIVLTRCLIMIYDPGNKGSWWWMANSEAKHEPIGLFVQYHEHPPYLAYLKAWESKSLRWQYNLQGQIKKDWDDFLFSQTELSQLPDFVIAGMKAPDSVTLSASFNNFGNLTLATLETLSEEHSDILLRFAKVFDLTYTRFNDLQKAEAQSREAQIELALERVRARTMAMQKSTELPETSLLLFQQLRELGETADQLSIGIVKEEEGIFELSTTVYGTQMLQTHKPRLDELFSIGRVYQAWKTKQRTVVIELTGEELKNYNILKNNDIRQTNLLETKFFNEQITPEDRWITSAACFSKGALIFSSANEVTKERLQLLERFAGVFEQTYTRFLDLQKSEAQARESQIQLALERVRARTMAMQRSEELAEAAALLFKQVSDFGIKVWSSAFQIWNADDISTTAWGTAPDGGIRAPFRLSYDEDIFFKKIYEARQSGKDFFVMETSGKELEDHYHYMLTLTGAKKHFDDALDSGFPIPKFQITHCAFFSQGYLMFITYEPCPEMWGIFKRFGKVFEQTYTRFLDLQKAEAQAREAQIEAALERIRSATMAMHSSEQLAVVIKTVTDQLQSLGFSFETANFITNFTDKGFNLWLSVPGVEHPSFIYVPYDDNAFFRFIQDGVGLKKEFDTLTGDKAEKDKFFTHFFSKSAAGNIPDERKKYVFDKPAVGFTTAFRKHFYFTIVNYEGSLHSSEENSILTRVANVFEQSYTRFLDLQKAEAQAREAQIEAALEKVRSRSLAMHRSDDLKEVIIEVLRKLQDLGIAMENKSAIICLYKEGSKEFEQWVASPEHSTAHEVKATFFDSKIHNDIWNARNNGTDFYAKSYTVEEKNAMFQFFFDHAELGSIPEKEKNWLREREYYELASAFEKHSAVMIANFTADLLDSGVHQILKRFAKVFEQAYIRFLDLQKAETQARESQIEAALEKVRSRTLAMQKSDELAETAAEVFRQLITLGIEPNRLYIGIIKEEEGDMEMWATDEDGTKVGKKFMFNKNENVSVNKLYEGWITKQKSVIVTMEGKELEDYFHYLNHVMHIPFKDGLTQKRRVQSVAYFSKGFIGMASPDGQGDETILLLERFAAVFNLTFTRFNDLKIAEAHAEQAELDLIQLKEEKKRTEEALNELQITQKQLIQSEKMASLGELTAGIAHEIQNPLNFVNNFSEVSTELVDEMNEEIQKGNLEEAQLIAQDLKDNLSKINHHGKRAGDIVKGMLQHSRSSSGVKEPTDINALADEYLRLAYHGLRAKDKSFNATMVTDYDASIGMVDLIPQDMGRVILNLITNAFYVVNEKKKQTGAGYEPTVSVSTKKNNGKLKISVKDNGNGISTKVLDKIFQPFFTTKPTGQGTGLGLSLSYDIVKAHGGELAVTTTEGEGTEFIIHLNNEKNN